MTTDLWEINQGYTEKKLLDAIKTHDLRTMTASLRELAGRQISSEIVNKLADYLDPAIENPRYKEGPKPKKKPLFVHRYSCVHFYKTLCEDEECRKVLPRKKEIKLLVSKMYGIPPRTFETWLAEYNKR